MISLKESIALRFNGGRDNTMSEVFRLVPASVKTLWVMGGIIALIVGILFVLGSIAYSSQNTRLEISPDGLTINSRLYGRTISAESLVSEEAKQVDLTQDSPYALRVRTIGVALPGYRAGWFRLRNGEKALVFVTDLERVVYVPTDEGYSILLSVAEPEEFLDTLVRTMSDR